MPDSTTDDNKNIDLRKILSTELENSSSLLYPLRIAEKQMNVTMEK